LPEPGLNALFLNALLLCVQPCSIAVGHTFPNMRIIAKRIAHP